MYVAIKKIFSTVFITLMVGLMISTNSVTADDFSHTAEAVNIPLASDLAATASISKQNNLPILLMFSAIDCDYCERLEDEILRPMMISGEIKTKAIVRKVVIDSYDKMVNFKGGVIDVDVFADMRGIEVTPTMQFVDSNGYHLSPPMVGFQGTDMYAAYFDRAIENSQQKLDKMHP